MRWRFEAEFANAGTSGKLRYQSCQRKSAANDSGNHNREDIMRKHLKRLIDRLRGTTNGRFRTPTSARGGLEQPQRMQTVPARTQHRGQG